MPRRSVTDLVSLHEIMWRVRPDLIVELGTDCGGSAHFFARTALGYAPHAKVITFDVVSQARRESACLQAHAHRQRLSRRGINAAYARADWKHVPAAAIASQSWADLVHAGSLINVTGKWWLADSQRLLARAAAAAERVMVIDDASHKAKDVLHVFDTLSPLVTIGSYYLVQDTRLDVECAVAILRLPDPSPLCRALLLHGGPATAVAKLSVQKSFQRMWQQDRTAELWGITQHPGGYLRRVRR